MIASQRLGLNDALRGWFYAFQRMVAETRLSLMLWEALKPGGVLICSTPYQGYLKNCALALSGKLDAHFTALWDGGHIKFWSRATLPRCRPLALAVEVDAAVCPQAADVSRSGCSPCPGLCHQQPVRLTWLPQLARPSPPTAQSGADP